MLNDGGSSWGFSAKQRAYVVIIVIKLVLLPAVAFPLTYLATKGGLIPKDDNLLQIVIYMQVRPLLPLLLPPATIAATIAAAAIRAIHCCHHCCYDQITITHRPSRRTRHPHGLQAAVPSSQTAVSFLAASGKPKLSQVRVGGQST